MLFSGLASDFCGQKDTARGFGAVGLLVGVRISRGLEARVGARGVQVSAGVLWNHS